MFVLTKDLSDIGMGIVAHQPIRATEVLIAVSIDDDMTNEPWFFIGKMKRISAIGGGFWILGVELTKFANDEYRDVLQPLLATASRLRVAVPVVVG